MAQTLDAYVTAARERLKQQTDAAVSAYGQKTDRATEQSVSEAQAALAEARAGYQTQRNAVNDAEQRQKDNRVLYDAARGDRGGIAGAQYDSIGNRAAAERGSINRAEEALTQSTAKRIADLRAEGEYQKADALLKSTQEYLEQLAALEKWAYETGAGEAAAAKKQQQWEQEYALKLKQYDLDAAGLYGTGADGTETRAAADARREQLAAAGEALLSYGITPNAEQLAAMGWTAEQLAAYRRLYPTK